MRITKKRLEGRLAIVNLMYDAKLGTARYMELDVARLGGLDYVITSHCGSNNLVPRLTAREADVFISGMIEGAEFAGVYD